MTNPLYGLEPSNLWKYFAEISAIPRESGNEKQAIDYLENLAKSRGFAFRRDKAGNIAIDVPASKGYENAPIVVLQGHADMVCVKDPGVEHDFKRDGIKLVVDGEWLRADGTSLGADNALGVASALAIIDEKNAIHPPLEILVTVEEETGMDGAKDIDPSIIKGRQLINLDAGDMDFLWIGCAGGVDAVIRFETPREELPDGIPLKIRISGLDGTHSGMEIPKNRANAIKILASILFKAERLGLRVCTMTSGVRRNVIAGTAEAVIVIKPEKLKKLKNIIAETESLFREEYVKYDSGMKLEIVESDERPDKVIKRKVVKKLISLILALPYGVLSMYQKMDNVVETSSNIGVLRDHGEYIEIIATTRSISDSAKKRVQDMIASSSALAGADIKFEHVYPAWEPDFESSFLKRTISIYRDIFKHDPNLLAIHAGLETAYFVQKFPGIEMVSFGAKGDGGHSTKERVFLPSVLPFFDFLKDLLERLTKKQS